MDAAMVIDLVRWAVVTALTGGLLAFLQFRRNKRKDGASTDREVIGAATDAALSAGASVGVISTVMIEVKNSLDQERLLTKKLTEERDEAREKLRQERQARDDDKKAFAEDIDKLTEQLHDALRQVAELRSRHHLNEAPQTS